MASGYEYHYHIILLNNFSYFNFCGCARDFQVPQLKVMYNLSSQPCPLSPRKLVILEDCWSNDKRTLKEFLMLAISRFRDIPSRCDTDGWHGYGKLLEKLGIERGVVHHFREWKSHEGYHTNNMERFWEDYSSWERKARGYKKIQNSSIYTVAYETFHNFLRPHLSLNKRTPYEYFLQDNPHLSWHYLVVRRMLWAEPAWKEDELKALPIPD